MKTFFFVLMAFGFFFFTAMQVSGAVSTSAEAVKPESAKLVGVLDLRPTWTMQAGSWATENSVELGIKTNANTQFSYCQFINTNLYSPFPADQGLGLSFPGAFVRAKFNNLWKNSDGKTAFHYQPRVYLPLAESDRQKGQITVWRNYFTLVRTMGENVSFSLVELPMVHFYSKAGTVGADGATAANPIFENRVYLIADFTLSKKLSLSVPLFIHATKHRNFEPGAKKNGEWAFFVYTWPEITYTLTDRVSMGAAVYTGNLMAGDMSALTIDEGLKSSAFQMVLTYSL